MSQYQSNLKEDCGNSKYMVHKDMMRYNTIYCLMKRYNEIHIEKYKKIFKEKKIAITGYRFSQGNVGTKGQAGIFYTLQLM